MFGNVRAVLGFMSICKRSLHFWTDRSGTTPYIVQKAKNRCTYTRFEPFIGRRRIALWRGLPGPRRDWRTLRRTYKWLKRALVNVGVHLLPVSYVLKLGFSFLCLPSYLFMALCIIDCCYLAPLFHLPPISTFYQMMYQRSVNSSRRRNTQSQLLLYCCTAAVSAINQKKQGLI